MNPLTLLDVLTQSGFQIGVGLGLAVSLAAWLHRRGSVWMASLGAAAILGLVLNGQFSRLPIPPVGVILAAAAVVALGARGLWRMSEDLGAAPVALCVALTALGIWGTVPDTENALVMLGVAAGGALGTLRLTTSTIHVIGAVAFWIVAAFTATTEGLARPSAVVGALATLGVFLLYPLAGRLWREAPAWSVVAVHVALVIVCGLVAGQASGALLAVGIAVLALAAGAGTLAAVSRWRQRP